MTKLSVDASTPVQYRRDSLAYQARPASAYGDETAAIWLPNHA